MSLIEAEGEESETEEAEELGEEESKTSPQVA